MTLSITRRRPPTRYRAGAWRPRPFLAAFEEILHALSKRPPLARVAGCRVLRRLSICSLTRLMAAIEPAMFAPRTSAFSPAIDHRATSILVVNDIFAVLKVDRWYDRNAEGCRKCARTRSASNSRDAGCGVDRPDARP